MRSYSALLAAVMLIVGASVVAADMDPLRMARIRNVHPAGNQAPDVDDTTAAGSVPADKLKPTTDKVQPTLAQIKLAYGVVPADLSPKYVPTLDVSCVYDTVGWLVEASCDGCPIKIDVNGIIGGADGDVEDAKDDAKHPGHPSRHPDHPHPGPPTSGPSCNVGSSNAAVKAGVLNCSSLCILSTGCPSVMPSCSIPTVDGSIIDVTALDCSAVNLLAVSH